jgi:hypothetical protein
MIRSLASMTAAGAWVAVVCALAPQLSAQTLPRERTQQTGGRRGGGFGGFGARGARATVDLPTARRLLLEKDPPEEGDFTALVQAAMQESTDRRLPTFMEDPDATYGPEQRAFRAEVYGPLLAEPRTREFLRSLAKRPATGTFGFSGSTAALVLADDPDEADLAALFEGYQATGPENRAGPARQLGRAIAAMKAKEPEAALAEEALARIRADAAEGKASQRGAAIEALFRAEETDEAVRVLRPLLAEGNDPLETATVLQACSRLFQRRDVDPFMKASAIATAEAAVEKLLASDEEVAPTQVISGEGRTLRAAIAFLQDAGGTREFDVLMRCLESPRALRLLGMDGLQTLRFGLQSRRRRVSAEQAARIDEHWLKLVVEAGSRLFALEEEPMEPEEQRAFWDARDLRYNALGYFCDQFARAPAAGGAPGVKSRLERELDLPAYLAALYQSREDVTIEGEDGSERFTAVAEKLENRVLALQLLSLIQREWNRDPGGLDLFAEALAMLCAEIQAPPPAPEQIAAFRESRESDRLLEIAVVRAPADNYVQGAAAQTIADLGYVVTSGPDKVVIRADLEHPWPWY